MIADALADQRGRADLGEGGPPRRGGIEAARGVLGGGFVDPVAQLVVDVAVGGARRVSTRSPWVRWRQRAITRPP